MFTVIYTFKILPGKVQEFIDNWEELTKLIYQHEGSYGSRLHKVSELNYLAYAHWPSKEIWSSSGKNLPNKASKFSKKMKAACETSATDYELEIVSDLLAINKHPTNDKQPKATGIGGIFFKAKNPDELKKWYATNLGFITDQYGSMFQSRNFDRPEETNYLQWSIFKNDTDYIKPSENNYMINYRVQDIEGLVEKFKNNNVRVLDDIASYEYGKFVHILDLEDNKIELWEPIDSSFDK